MAEYYKPMMGRGQPVPNKVLNVNKPATPAAPVLMNTIASSGDGPQPYTGAYNTASGWYNNMAGQSQQGKSDLNYGNYNRLQNLVDSTQMSPWAAAQGQKLIGDSRAGVSGAISQAAMSGGVRGGTAARIAAQAQNTTQGNLQNLMAQDLQQKYGLAQSMPATDLARAQYEWGRYFDPMVLQGQIQAGKDKAAALREMAAAQAAQNSGDKNWGESTLSAITLGIL